MTRADFTDVAVSTLMTITGHDPVRVVLRWSTQTPLLVTIHIHVDGMRIDWDTTRALIADGLTGRAGDGDIRVEPL